MTNKKGDQESPKALATPIPQSTTARVPPPETSETTHTRFYVIAAFWAVIVFLGFPLWWQTTSIYRAHLPIQDMVDWDDGKVCQCACTRWQGLYSNRTKRLTIAAQGMSPCISIGNSRRSPLNANRRISAPSSHNSAYP